MFFLYVSFVCVAKGSAVLCILRSRLLLYSAGSGVNTVQVVLSGYSVRLICVVQAKTLVCMVVCISWLHSSCVCRSDADAICVGHDLNR